MFNLERYKQNTAVITDKGEWLTYTDLAVVANAFAEAIPHKGLLFCLCENRIGSLVGYVACMEHHIPIVLLDGSKDLSVLQNLAAIYQPEYIWADNEKVDEIGGETIYKYSSYSLQKMSYEVEVDKPGINPELALCLTTSGSTGSPKFVRLSVRNVLANAESIAEYLEINENERPVTILPSYYSYGVSVINSHLIKGATILLTEGTVAQRDFWNFMKEQKATSIAGVPYTYEMLKMLRFMRMDLPYLKTMTQAGGKLNKDLAKEYIEWAQSKDKRFFVMYGQTEATARMSYLPLEHALDKYASIGIAIPRGKFSLIDVNGNAIDETDVDGELVYEGPNVSLGYAECRADLAKGDENHGVLHTGDVARRDTDGYYYITGRLKRFVKVWGNRCNLDATEQIVKSNVTTSCACVGVDDKITIFVTEQGMEEQIVKLLVEKTGLNNKAFEVRVIDAIPVKSSGKIDYPAMQAMIEKYVKKDYMTLEELLEIAPYSLGKEDKHKVLDEYLVNLTKYHFEQSVEYRKMLDGTGFDISKVKHYEDLPYLPVSLFKDLTLRSVAEDEVIKTMTSSGTTGQKTSKIYLDRETSANQTKTLTKIVASLLGNKRVPMIILDSSNVVKDRNMFSARGAGILGFSMFGSKRIYALDENMELDIEGMKAFLEEHKDETIFLFGFTFMIWEHFYKKLKESGYKPDLSKGVLIHGGGWKKLVAESVSTAQFKQCLNDVCGIKVENVHDYYGMVEQTGTIYIECECGHLHASNFSDIIIRNPKDFSVAKNGETGIIEVVSVLPKSYPGHVLLTEDEGVVLGEDDCPCGRKGKYFHIHGRIKNAEIRGCSDTYAAKFGKLSGLEYVIGDDKTIEEMPHVPALPPFAEPVISFFNDLSKLVMQRGRQYSDVMTFGFWCRKGALMQEKAKYIDLERRLGRGIVFHSTPSNVPVNCAFSFAAGLLAGNANIVRLPAKDFPQVQIISDCVRVLLETTHKDMAPYICFVKYPPIKEITDLFSGMCQSRVVWGGDATIAEIRQSPLQPRANEVNFADRYSFSVLNADAFLSADDQDKVVQNFYNDTYFSDQNACTAPRIIVWVGEKKSEAKELFWKKVVSYAQEHYNIAPVQTIGKINALYKAAANLKLGKVTVEQPLLTRIQVDTLAPVLMDYRFNSGFFYEYDAKSLTDLLPIATIKSQTVTYYGLTREEIIKFVNEDHPQGVDRFVPLGKSMDFTLVWDGYDLITTLSRIVNII